MCVNVDATALCVRAERENRGPLLRRFLGGVALLELLLFVLGDCELDSNDERQLFYETERAEWSKVLNVALDRLEHIELMWLFASVTPMGWVERTPSFKEKRRVQPDDVNLALFNYPVLQAADIAIYKADYVPVGKDQAAHLELAREIVRAFNSRYGETFPEPQAVFSDAPIVKGTDGENKMSKSLGNVIEIFADEETIRKQVMSMVTDTQRQRLSDPGRPEVCNVCQMHRIFSSHDYEEIWEGERSATTGCVATKRLLVERMLGFFAEARERYAELKAKPRIVEEVLAAGADTLAPKAAEPRRMSRREITRSTSFAKSVSAGRG